MVLLIIFFEINTLNSLEINNKKNVTGQTGDDGTKCFEIMVPLKYLSNFWITLEMGLINCEIKLILNLSANCVIVSTAVANQGTTLAMTDAKIWSGCNFVNSR